MFICGRDVGVITTKPKMVSPMNALGRVWFQLKNNSSSVKIFHKITRGGAALKFFSFKLGF